MKTKIYLFCEYIITEYEIIATSREEAEEKIYSTDCEQASEWLDKTTLRVKPKQYDLWKNKKGVI